jgi:flagellin-specific chaperone FliS
MYNRYKQSNLQSLTVNQQISAVLKKINQQLQESDHLFRTYKVAESIEIGEKCIYRTIALSDIMKGYIDKALAEPQDDDVKDGLKSLQRHFDYLHQTINQYVMGRDKELLGEIIKNLEAMEKFWAELTPLIPENTEN